MKQLSTLGRRRREVRRRFIWGMIKLLGAGALLFLFAVSAFEAGTSQRGTELEQLNRELTAAKAENFDLTERLAAAEDSVDRLERQLAALRLDYAANVPAAEYKELLGLLQARMRAGVPRERLAFVIDRAGRERSCESGVETRRLTARTPVSTVLDNSVAFAERRITVSGEGRPARDENGEALSWFDPAAPVTLRFLTITGDVSSVTGRLPLNHSVVMSSREWLFQATTAGEAGRIEITAQVCAYP